MLKHVGLVETQIKLVLILQELYLSGELAGGFYTALGVSCLLHALPYNYLALCAATVAHPYRKLTIKTNKVLFSSTTEPDNSLNIYPIRYKEYCG